MKYLDFVCKLMQCLTLLSCNFSRKKLQINRSVLQLLKIAKLKTLLIDYFIILQFCVQNIIPFHFFFHSILPMKIQNRLKSKKSWHQMGTLMVDLDLLTPKAILYSLNMPKMLRDNCKIFRIIIFYIFREIVQNDNFNLKTNFFRSFGRMSLH